MLETLLHERYRIIQELGSGGFGQTYIAEDIRRTDDRKCVVKQFKPSRQDKVFLKVARRLFSSEVEILRKLGSHDQIPTLWDDFEENQEFYLVQEYIEGYLLSDEITLLKRLTEADIFVLLQDVLHVLEFVHQNQVIHRDIKPSNLIRRQQDGRYVLIDFGAVKEIQTQLSEPGQTNLTVGIGTQGYGPSEQLMGKPRYSSDLYALGVTAIQSLTGLQPSQLPSHPETGEIIWLDQAEVSPKLATILTRMTRLHFSQRYQSATEVLQMLDAPTEVVLKQPTELAAEKPTEILTASLTDTTLIPDISTQNLAVTQAWVHSPEKLVEPEGRRVKGRFLASLSVAVASVVATGLVVGMRQLGWVQPLELLMFDRMTQSSPDPGPDPRLLVVGINDADIQAQKQFPLSDKVVAQLLKTLKPLKPRAIGLDLLRDIPQEPGHSELQAELNATNLIAITNLGNSDVAAAPPPPGIPENRIGFNDLVLDFDGIVRRNLLFGDSKEKTYFSFSLRLVLLYLSETGIVLKPAQDDPNYPQLGKSTLYPLKSNSGGYQNIDDRGYQILLKYRSKNPARQVSLSDVLAGHVNPEWVRDKIVLIGTTAPTGRDLFFTPYSAAEPEAPKMAGVLLHAELVSQLLEAALGGRSLFWFWPEWVEVIWIAGWGISGGILAWCIRRPIVLGITGAALLLTLSSVGFGLFTQMGWVPVAAPVIAAISTGIIVVTYRAYQV